MEQKPEPEKICTECGHKLPANYFDNSDKCYLCDVEPTNKPEALTWDEALNQAANEMFKMSYILALYHKKSSMGRMHARAADLYARSKWEQACKDQMKAFFDGLKNKVLPELKPGTLTYYAIEELIKRQEEHPFPAPEFKA